MAGIDRELVGIKERAFENVSKKLKGFEDEFLADLSRRSADIDSQLAAWQEKLGKELESLGEESETKRQKAESQFIESTRKAIAAQGEKILSELERLKAETAAFEEGIREEMHGADESRKSFNEQLERDLAELKNTAENELNSKIGQYSVSVSDTIRQNQRDLEAQIRDLADETREQFTTLESSSETFRKNIEEWQTQYNIRMRELDDSMEEARRKGRDLAAENDERVTATKASMDDIRREIAVQTKLFDRTDTLKTELNRHVEDMSSNIERILQFKNEIAHFENQFTQIKRLEDDVNAKMTRFLSEKRRIEVMESDFTRLIQTSQSVEEKLVHVSNSDDILQTIQVQIRRLDDSIKDTEEKYQRIERKNKTLQETNDGIDRNFKILQENEQLVKKLEGVITMLRTDMDAIQGSVEKLSGENEKARDAAEKLSTLDETVKWLEKRIAEMNVARESFARLATELQNLDKDAQNQLNLTRTLLNREEGKLQGRAGKAGGKGAGKAADEGAPPPRDRENVIRLKRQGWKNKEIAQAMNMSESEIELILELGPKDV
jgi:chromosome segregation ATPase